MQRRRFLIGGMAIVAVHGASAQQPGKPWRVGYLSLASPDSDRHWVAALREGLKVLGYVEGRNLVLEQRHAFNQVAKVPDLAADLVRRQVAVMVVYGSPAVAALKASALKVPIVMTVHADPVGSGVVASLARPGGNITGLTDGHADLAPKRLQVLKEVVPSVARVAALFNPRTTQAMRQWKLVQAAAPRLGVAVLPAELGGAGDIEHAFAAIARQRADAVFMIPDPSWWTGHERRIADLAIKQRLPSIGTVREFAEHGLLVAYGTNFSELWRRSATYVDKILRGAKAADLSIEQPTRFDLVINVRTAKALGLTLSQALIARADHIVGQ